MTLQYKIRSKFEDQKWQKRVFLCEKFLLATIDHWCRSDKEFPTQRVVAGVLYLFSPRCDPFELSSHRLGEDLATIVFTPESEYQLAYPRRDSSIGKFLIDSLSNILSEAVKTWTNGSIWDPSSEFVTQQLSQEILDQGYVVFHHCETTKRDNNHWGI